MFDSPQDAARYVRDVAQADWDQGLEDAAVEIDRLAYRVEEAQREIEHLAELVDELNTLLAERAGL